jgi:hypothetical protein
MSKIKVLVDVVAETNHKGEIPAEVRQAMADALMELADSLYALADALEQEVKKHGNLV